MAYKFLLAGVGSCCAIPLFTLAGSELTNNEVVSNEVESNHSSASNPTKNKSSENEFIPQPLYLRNAENKIFFVAKATSPTHSEFAALKDNKDEKNYSCVFESSKNAKSITQTLKNNENFIDCNLYSLNSWKNYFEIEINELTNNKSRNLTDSITKLWNNKEDWMVVELEKNAKNEEIVKKLKELEHNKLFVLNKPVYDSSRKSNFYNDPMNRFYFYVDLASDPLSVNNSQEITSQYFLINKTSVDNLFNSVPTDKNHKCKLKDNSESFDCSVLGFQNGYKPTINKDKTGKLTISNLENSNSDEFFMRKTQFVDNDNINDEWFILQIKEDKKSNTDFYGKALEVTFNGNQSKQDFRIDDLLIGFTILDGDELSFSSFFIPK